MEMAVGMCSCLPWWEVAAIRGSRFALVREDAITVRQLLSHPPDQPLRPCDSEQATKYHRRKQAGKIRN